MSERLDRATWRVFDAMFDPWLRRRIRVRLSGLPTDVPRDGPLLLVANHVSWWDGFLLRAVQRAIRPGAALHAVALDSELAKHVVLRRLGSVGLDPESPGSILRALRTLGALRTRSPDTTFAYFPQGRITPAHARPLGFRRGVDLVIRALAPVTVIPVALHVEPLTHVAPTALISVGSPIRAPSSVTSHIALERAIARLLDDTLAFAAAHGERADSEWPRHRCAEPPRLTLRDASA